MTALPGAGGITAAGAMRVAGATGSDRRSLGCPGRTRPCQARPRARRRDPPYAIPAIRIEAIDAPLPIRAGYMRGAASAR